MISTGLESKREIERIERRLQSWRANRRMRERIPEPLWNEAAELARKYGVNKVARALRLDYYNLKERRDSTTASKEGKPQRAGFVELVGSISPGNECVIELERCDGGKMRIQMKGVAPADLCDFAEIFWKQGR